MAVVAVRDDGGGRPVAEGTMSAMAIAFHRAGSGPPLVLLHGLGADRHVWDPVIPRLGTQRTVFAVDLPGFGQSPPRTGTDPSPRVLAEAVATWLSEQGLDDGRPLHLAGNSLGGWVALELGLMGIGSSLMGIGSSVTAIAPAGLWNGPLLPKASLGHRLARALQPLAVGLMSTDAGRRALLAGSVAHPERVPAADARRLIRAYAGAPGFVTVNDAMRAGRFTELGRIDVPVTLVWCEHDRLVERLEHVPPGVRSVDLADAGHVPMWDQPSEVAATLLAGSAAASDPLGAAD